jgi:N-acyl-D-amino-acid deacylase
MSGLRCSTSDFFRAVVVLFLLAGLLRPIPVAAATLIENIRVVDGSGSPARAASVLVSGRRVTAVGNIQPMTGDTIVDGGGLVLAPGFIDTHSHLDRTMFTARDVPAAVSQGVTTIIVGQDGLSPLPVSDLAKRLRATTVAVNVGTYSGHNDLRRRIMGAARRHATAAETAAMVGLLKADMDAGAFGLSTGLIYEPGAFSNRAEVMALAKAAARHGGRYTSHIRNEADKLDEAVEEFLAVGRATGMPIKLSHIKIALMNRWGDAQALLKTLDRARAEGVDVTADVYPYTYWQTTMGALFPDKNYDDPAGVTWNFQHTTPPDRLTLARFMPDPALERRTIAEIAAARGEDPAAVYVSLMNQAITFTKTHPLAGKVEAIVGESMAEADVSAFLAWPHANICSDGADGGHPRGYGTFTRVLGRYVRETGLLGLEEAVHKMTGLAASHLGLRDRGLVRPGMRADLVLLNPETVADRASLADDRAYSTGIAKVWVNGTLVFVNGETQGAWPGEFLRAHR